MIIVIVRLESDLRAENESVSDIRLMRAGQDRAVTIQLIVNLFSISKFNKSN